MWSKVKTRLISALILVALVMLALFLAPELGIALIVNAVTYAVMYELTKVFNLKEKKSITIANFIFATLFMGLGYLDSATGTKYLMPLFVLYIIVMLVISVFDNNRVKFADVSASVFLLVYSVVLLLHITYLRKLDNGVAFVILACIGAYITDTGAYFTGLLFGRHKLIESVSPKKTVEGAIGGVVFAVVGFLIFGIVMKSIGNEVNFLNLMILSLVCAVAAQFGDLSASAMKRSYSVKDFGNIIPGHGGMVDRVDSLMFVAPVVYHFILAFPVIR